MDIQTFAPLFSSIFEENGLSRHATSENIIKFHTLTEHMTAVNAVMNLTAICAPHDMIALHYADCALAADLFPTGATVADVGCGGGFPTLPLAILRPDLRITAIDSTGKKVQYVAETAQLLGLSNVKTIAARAEDLGRDPSFRETFDIVTSRAVARLNILSELCLPLCRVGGELILLKGGAGREELSEASTSIPRLGGDSPACIDTTLSLCGDVAFRTLIRVPKSAPTPPEFPRSFGQIKKKPL